MHRVTKNVAAFWSDLLYRSSLNFMIYLCKVATPEAKNVSRIVILIAKMLKIVVLLEDSLNIK